MDKKKNKKTKVKTNKDEMDILLKFGNILVISAMTFVFFFQLLPEFNQIIIREKEVVELKAPFVHQEEIENNFYKVYYKNNTETKSFLVNKEYFFNLIENNIEKGDIITAQIEIGTNKHGEEIYRKLNMKGD